MPVLVEAWPPTGKYTVLEWDAQLMKCDKWDEAIKLITPKFVDGNYVMK